MIHFLEIVFNCIWGVINKILSFPISYEYTETLNGNVWQGMKLGDVLLIVIIVGIIIRFLIGMKG